MLSISTNGSEKGRYENNNNNNILQKHRNSEPFVTINAIKVLSDKQCNWERIYSKLKNNYNTTTKTMGT